MHVTYDDLVVIKQVVRQVCRFHPMDEAEVLSRTLERLWRWYDPDESPEVTLTQATRRRASLALSDVLAAAPPEIPADLNRSEWEDVAPLWRASEEVMSEDELARSDVWVDLVGSVAAGVSVRAATVVEMMFRGRLKQNVIAHQLDISPPAVHKHWTRARAHLRSVLPEPVPVKEKGYLSAGAWGTVRGTVYH